MERLDGTTDIPPAFAQGVVALGNFDGFHLGHQAVVGRAIALAREEHRPAIVATFDPHPVRYFKPETEPFRLTTLDQREALFSAAGADAMLVYPFNAALAALSAEAFAREKLRGLRGVITGQDFTFGNKRGGNVAVIARLGEKYGFIAETIAPVSDGGAIISSSRIREAIKSGDCATATHLLTRPFTIEGVVEHGAKLGRTIGYPTANITLSSYLRPRYGIYAVRVILRDGRVVAGAANIGIRPSFEPPVELLEAFLFDFNESLYDQKIAVELHAFIRPEAKFDDLAALVCQMDKDCLEAKRILSQ